MAKYITQKTLLKRLEAKGIKISRQSLFNYKKSGVFIPVRTIAYGRTGMPIYEEGDVDRLYRLIVRRYKHYKTKHKGLFLNGVPDRKDGEF